MVDTIKKKRRRIKRLEYKNDSSIGKKIYVWRKINPTTAITYEIGF